MDWLWALGVCRLLGWKGSRVVLHCGFNDPRISAAELKRV